MHNSTANALLKILEEPPGDTLFFLVSNNYQKLLSTILSRVQMFKVKSFEDEDIKNYFRKFDDVSESEVDSAIYLSGSNINTAEKILRDATVDNLNYLKEWLRNCYSENFLEINKKLDWFNDLSKIKKRAFLMYSLKLMREALVSKIDLSLVNHSKPTHTHYNYNYVPKYENLSHHFDFINYSSTYKMFLKDNGNKLNRMDGLVSGSVTTDISGVNIKAVSYTHLTLPTKA